MVTKYISSMYACSFRKILIYERVIISFFKLLFIYLKRINYIFNIKPLNFWLNKIRKCNVYVIRDKMFDIGSSVIIKLLKFLKI